MINIYQPQSAKIIFSKIETSDTRLLRLKFLDAKIQKNFAFIAGQFLQIGLAGWGECPISICSSPQTAKKYFELAVRNVGPLTNRLNSLTKGEIITIRGPFGNGFDTDKFLDRNLVLIGGGCGFVPLRPLIIDFLSGRLKAKNLQIFYGCLNEQTILFHDERAAWNRRSELAVILEKPSSSWRGEKGLITDLIIKRRIAPDSVVVLVGPPVMYRFAIKELKNKKIKDENIYLSLERRMSCGVGLCQHCAIGPYYVCKDGPVFAYAQIKNIPEVI